MSVLNTLAARFVLMNVSTLLEVIFANVQIITSLLQITELVILQKMSAKRKTVRMTALLKMELRFAFVIWDST